MLGVELNKRKERDWEENGSSLPKPKFLSKAEREKLKIKEKAKEVEDSYQKKKEIEKNREYYFHQAHKDKKRLERKEREREREREKRERDFERERERERDRERRKRREKENKDEKDSSKSNEDDLNNRNISEKEIEMIKKQYLGGKKEKKKLLKPSEKFKFVFDWDASEDTTRNDLNPLYQQRVNVRQNNGNGIDHRERTKERPKKLSTLEKAELPTKHWSEKNLNDMKPRDWRIFREDFNITTRGGNIPNPIRYWKETTLRKDIMDAIKKAGYKDPTPIQRQAIPIGLQGRDIIGIAETGSGKTAAFVIPLLEYCLQLPKMTPESAIEGPYALILAPTRELAQQIAVETEKLARYCDLRVMSIVGGTSIEEQGFQLRRGVEVLIATPGRLNDLVDSRYLVLNQCNYVVLDEADKMIDMGFEAQVHSILDVMPSSNLKSEDELEAEKQEKLAGNYRTTTMYSATMPVGVERLARKYLRRPAYIIIGEIGKAVGRIEQRVEFIKDEAERGRKLAQILKEGPEPPIMIFVNTKNAAESIAKQVSKLDFRATTLHAGRSQHQREAAINAFKNGTADILVATDVAGRGIDVPGVTHVINYHLPKTIENYTHRIGRTGRAGLKGLATSFLTNDDTDVMYDLKKMLMDGGHYVPHELANHPAAQYKPGTIPDKKPRKDTVIYVA